MQPLLMDSQLICQVAITWVDKAMSVKYLAQGNNTITDWALNLGPLDHQANVQTIRPLLSYDITRMQLILILNLHMLFDANLIMSTEHVT